MERVYLMGDIHGSWKPVRDFYQRHPFTLNNGKNILILLGDAGLNFFFNHRDEEFKKKLGKYPFTYFVVRGNHEERPGILYEKNPGQWHAEPFWGNTVYVENEYPYIKYALDDVNFYQIPYGIDYVSPDNPKDDDIEIVKTYKTLIIPGAYSVDKYRRLEMGWSWFPHEQLSEEEMKQGQRLIECNNWKCDLVLSHTCPIIYEPTDLFLSVVDQSMVDKSMERYLGQVEYNLDYKTWCWGHYHQYRDYPCVDGKKKIMLFQEAVELTNIMEDIEVEKL